jgi:hypothetical protein
VNDKYGITLHEKPYRAEKEKLNRGVISASNSSGQRIQVTLELTDNDTDILAFSSGTEMPQISKNTTDAK